MADGKNVYGTNCSNQLEETVLFGAKIQVTKARSKHEKICGIWALDVGIAVGLFCPETENAANSNVQKFKRSHV